MTVIIENEDKAISLDPIIEADNIESILIRLNLKPESLVTGELSSGVKITCCVDNQRIIDEGYTEGVEILNQAESIEAFIEEINRRIEASDDIKAIGLKDLANRVRLHANS